MASPAGIPLTQGTCAPIETLHVHFTLPFVPLGGEQMAAFLGLIQTYIFF